MLRFSFQFVQFRVQDRHPVFCFQHTIQFRFGSGQFSFQVGEGFLFHIPPLHVWDLHLLVHQKTLAVFPISKLCRDKGKPVLLEFFIDIFSCRIVVRNNGNRLPVHDRVGENIQDHLRLAGSRRPFDQADLASHRVLDRRLLAQVEAERIEDRSRMVSLYRHRSPLQIIVQHAGARNDLHFVIICFQNVFVFHLQPNLFGQLAEVSEPIPAAASRLLGHAYPPVLHGPITAVGKNDARILAEFLHAVRIQPQIVVQKQGFPIKQLRFHSFEGGKIGRVVPKRTAVSKSYQHKRPAFFICKLCNFLRPILPFEKDQMRWVSFHKIAPCSFCSVIR